MGIKPTPTLGSSIHLPLEDGHKAHPLHWVPQSICPWRMGIKPTPTLGERGFRGASAARYVDVGLHTVHRKAQRTQSYAPKSPIALRSAANWRVLLAPTRTLVTPSCSKIHARARSARDCPCCLASSLYARSLSRRPSVSTSFRSDPFCAIRLSAGIPLR